MDEKKLDDLLTMKIEERWRELLADADELIEEEEPWISSVAAPTSALAFR